MIILPAKEPVTAQAKFFSYIKGAYIVFHENPNINCIIIHTLVKFGCFFKETVITLLNIEKFSMRPVYHFFTKLKQNTLLYRRLPFFYIRD